MGLQFWKKKTHQLGIGKIYLYGKDPFEAKYQFLINKQERTGLRQQLNDPKAVIEFSNNMCDIYKNIEECNSNEKRKIFIVFDDMITDMFNNKKRNPIVSELFIRDRKLKIYLVFTTQSYFPETKNIRLSSRHYFIMKIPNKPELQQMTFNNSSDTEFF